MAVAIPIIASFATAGAAVAAAGTLAAAVSTVSGFLAVAGAALTGIGALTGKKDVMRIGSLMSLGGGIGNAMGATAAEEGATAASPAWDAAESAAGSDAAQFGKYAQAGNEMSGTAVEAATKTAPGIDSAIEEAASAGADRFAYQDAFEQASGGSPIMDRAAVGQRGVEDRIYDEVARPDPVSQAGSRLTSNQVQAALQRSAEEAQARVVPSIGDRLKSSIYDAGKFVRDNKEMFQVGGKALEGLAGGYQAGRQMDLQESIMQRRLRNLNSPIALGSIGVRG